MKTDRHGRNYNLSDETRKFCRETLWTKRVELDAHGLATVPLGATECSNLNGNFPLFGNGYSAPKGPRT